VVVESTLATFTTALQRGDAELAEDAIAKAIADGLSPKALQGEVIIPALRRIDQLREVGEIDLDREHLATSITRRVLATLYRYMIGSNESALGSTGATRERVLLAGVEGDEHTLELEMVRDQLAAAGYETIFDANLSVERLRDLVESQAPDVIVLGAPVVAAEGAIKQAVRDLRASHPDLPIVLGGAAVSDRLSRGEKGISVLESVDESVEAVEHLLTHPTAAASI
jgi:5-methyltetrahydrofolate--homocysteine methyltransferase